MKKEVMLAGIVVVMLQLGLVLSGCATLFGNGLGWTTNQGETPNLQAPNDLPTPQTIPNSDYQVASAEEIRVRETPPVVTTFGTPELRPESGFSLRVTLRHNHLNPKKGVGVVTPNCEDVETLRLSWYLNWGPTPFPDCQQDDERFVPRISNLDMMQHLPVAVEQAKVSGWLIGFNEPNLAHQGDLSPEVGAELWRQIEEAVAGTDIRLVSPAPSQHPPDQVPGDRYGHLWLWVMVDHYTTLYGQPPHFDAIGLNVYGCAYGCVWPLETMQFYLTQQRAEALRRGYDIPIWILEYGGCSTSNSQRSDKIVMETMTQWFNQTEWIDRYAWFSNRGNDSPNIRHHNCVLISREGEALTTLGKMFQKY